MAYAKAQKDGTWKSFFDKYTCSSIQLSAASLRTKFRADAPAADDDDDDDEEDGEEGGLGGGAAAAAPAPTAANKPFGDLVTFCNLPDVKETYPNVRAAALYYLSYHATLPPWSARSPSPSCRASSQAEQARRDCGAGDVPVLQQALVDSLMKDALTKVAAETMASLKGTGASSGGISGVALQYAVAAACGGRAGGHGTLVGALLARCRWPAATGGRSARSDRVGPGPVSVGNFSVMAPQGRPKWYEASFAVVLMWRSCVLKKFGVDTRLAKM